ncbi:MAG TPA: penicillin-binding transpeptidase domain-containing protein, partial [Candidatus Baltobacteraceae bacterium]|nr:penicillin-binding transpeptidase domain-containing protein [Candidatus Baltobacteraceae bacterium]
MLFTAGLLLALLVLVARLVQLQIGEHATYLQRARANQIRLIPVPPPRGRLYDRTGRVLVRSRPSFVVEIVPSEISDSHAAIAELAQLLALPEDTLWKRVLHHRGINYHNFDEVVTGEPFGPVIVANDLTHAQLSRLAEERIDGVQVSVEPVRDYPYRSLGSHIFGYVGAITEDEFKRLRSKGYTANDVVGKDGLEAAYDDALRGIPGGERIEVDAQGQIVRRVAPQVAIPGHGLILTLDWHLQQIVERALENGIATVAQTRGRTISGAVVVLDPYSGAVLALASNPNFDPNDFARGIGERRYARYLNDPLEPLYDRAIAAATATGSTFKMITGSAALSAGVVQRDEIVYDSGYWNCHGQLFRDIAAGGLGATTFVTALAASSDGYFYQMADRLGYDRLSSYARKFGIAARSGIDLPGEYPGNWPTDAWTRKVYGVPL